MRLRRASMITALSLLAARPRTSAFSEPGGRMPPRSERGAHEHISVKRSNAEEGPR